MPKVFKDFGNWQIFDLIPVYFIIAIAVVFIAAELLAPEIEVSIK